MLSRATIPSLSWRFCIFKKSAYASTVTEALHQFKFKYFGHDAAVLHEREIRKAIAPFAFLQNPTIRGPFLADLNQIVAGAPFTLVAAVIRKDRLVSDGRADRWHPYHAAMLFGLERVAFFLRDQGVPRDVITHVVFESRGKAEDNELELEFRRVKDTVGNRAKLEIILASKAANHCGLQFADLIARPIGIHVLRPAQANRAYAIIEGKFRRSESGVIDGYGLKVFP